jgi:hypothetical protein
VSSSSSSDDGVLTQEGVLRVAPHSEVVVYYPIPYSNIPNLTIDQSTPWLTITEQKEDHFRVANKNGESDVGWTWKARGLRVQPQPEASPASAQPEQALTQVGPLNVPENSEVTIYYPIPYSNIPNLIISDNNDNCLTITEQKEDHFRIANKGNGWSSEWKWTARGVPVQPPVAVSPTLQPPAAEQTGQPPQGPPVPVQIGQPK